MSSAEAIEIETRAGTQAVGGTATRVLIVDDHRAVRKGLTDLLVAEPDFEPVGTASDLAGGAQAALRLRPDLAIIDYSLGSDDGLQLCRVLQALDDPPRVLIFSAYVDDQLTLASIVAGAEGILTKGVLGKEVCAAARKVARGDTVRPAVSSDAAMNIVARLDPDDAAIAAMLLAGSGASEIAERLKISRDQLDARRWAILKRLRKPGRTGPVNDRQDAVLVSTPTLTRPASRAYSTRHAVARTHGVRSALRQLRP
jgi:DNA-binding NarL/FixJ family response regulator